MESLTTGGQTVGTHSQESCRDEDALKLHFDGRERSIIQDKSLVWEVKRESTGKVLD